MAKMGTELINTIPVVDLSPFFHLSKDDSAKENVRQTISDACRTYGFFRIVGHGVPAELMRRAIDLSRSFFDLPDEEKDKSGPSPGSDSPLPTGFMRQPEISGNKNEYVLMLKPDLGVNVYPTEPPEFRSVLDECFTRFSETALLVERILTESMGLPPNFIKGYDESRNTDLMVALRYFPATSDVENNGLAEHQDGSCITLVLQDDVGGLEVLKGGEWIAVEPLEGSIVVNIGDILQVISLSKSLSWVISQERDRYSFAFFFNADGEKWIEPLPRFTGEVGLPPEYRGFWYKDYLRARMKNLSLPREEFFDISRYAISHCELTVEQSEEP